VRAGGALARTRSALPLAARHPRRPKPHAPDARSRRVHSGVAEDALFIFGPEHALAFVGLSRHLMTTRPRWRACCRSLVGSLGRPAGDSWSWRRGLRPPLSCSRGRLQLAAVTARTRAHAAGIAAARARVAVVLMGCCVLIFDPPLERARHSDATAGGRCALLPFPRRLARAAALETLPGSVHRVALPAVVV